MLPQVADASEFLFWAPPKGFWAMLRSVAQHALCGVHQQGCRVPQLRHVSASCSKGASYSRAGERWAFHRRCSMGVGLHAPSTHALLRCEWCCQPG
jgi:hypothetical protein